MQNFAGALLRWKGKRAAQRACGRGRRKSWRLCGARPSGRSNGLVGKRSVEQEVNGFLIRHLADEGEVEGFEVGVLFQGFDEHGAECDLLDEVVDDPAVGADWLLLEEELAAGIDVS